MDDLDKHVLEQAKTEVEHTRSWPTKVLAFYAATNAAIATGLFTLAGRTKPVVAPACVRVGLTIAVLVLAVWALYLLRKNHRSYLSYRNLQIEFQTANAAALKAKYSIPVDWLKPNDISLRTRWTGWAFYGLIVCLIAILTGVAIWVA